MRERLARVHGDESRLRIRSCLSDLAPKLVIVQQVGHAPAHERQFGEGQRLQKEQWTKKAPSVLRLKSYNQMGIQLARPRSTKETEPREPVPKSERML